MPKGDPRQSRNFRLTPEALEQLATLSEQWGASQAHVIEILVREAIREGRELRAIKSAEISS